MLSDIFEMFYAKVRARQYMQYIVNIAHFKNDYLPVLKIVDKFVIFNNICFYYEHKQGESLNDAIINNIVHNPRTYLYNINNEGKYIFAKYTFSEAVDHLNAKKYKKIELVKKPNENA